MSTPSAATARASGKARSASRRSISFPRKAKVSASGVSRGARSGVKEGGVEIKPRFYNAARASLPVEQAAGT